jgi:hypothetical protein
MASVTPDQAHDFHRAAASFYLESPWRSVVLDEPIKVESSQVEGGPRFAIVLGKEAKTKDYGSVTTGRPASSSSGGDTRSSPSTARIRHSTSEAAGRSIRGIWRRRKGTASRWPVPGRTRPQSARSEGCIPWPRRRGTGDPGSLPLGDPDLPQADRGPQAGRLRAPVRIPPDADRVVERLSISRGPARVAATRAWLRRALTLLRKT